MEFTTLGLRNDVIEAHKQGVSKSEIARRFGINRLTVRRITDGLYKQEAPQRKAKYSEFYEYAARALKGGKSMAEILREHEGEKPGRVAFLQWVRRNASTYQSAKAGRKAKSANITRFDTTLVKQLQKRLFCLVLRVNPKFRNPIWREELIAEMQLVSFQHYTEWNGVDKVPGHIVKAAVKAADKLSMLLGHTRTEETKKERIQRQEWATFDYDTPEGDLIKQVCSAYTLWGMDGVENVTNIADPATAEKILKEWHRF